MFQICRNYYLSRPTRRLQQVCIPCLHGEKCGGAIQFVKLNEVKVKGQMWFDFSEVSEEENESEMASIKGSGVYIGECRLLNCVCLVQCRQNDYFLLFKFSSPV